MTEWHGKSKRKSSGARRMSTRRCDKKLAWKGGHAAMTEVEEKDKRKTVSTRGGNKKVKVKAAKTASVSIPGQKKAVNAKIIAVSENQANRLYTRKNIVTKGAVIKVEINGKESLAKVKSRPGQAGTVQAVLVE